jgi:hypothetical protein
MVKTRVVLSFVVLALAASLGGCGSLKSAIGMGKEGPDEFTVVAKQPLIIPPDYTLRPPEPGAPNAQEVSSATTASTAIFGNNIVGTTEEGVPAAVGMGGSQPPSSGESAILAAAKAQNANPRIRAVVNRETAAIAEKSQSLTDDILFWRDPQSPDVVLDAEKEAQRLRENAAAGRPANAGTVPQIKRTTRGLLEGIF